MFQNIGMSGSANH